MKLLPCILCLLLYNAQISYMYLDTFKAVVLYFLYHCYVVVNKTNGLFNTDFLSFVWVKASLSRSLALTLSLVLSLSLTLSLSLSLSLTLSLPPSPPPSLPVWTTSLIDCVIGVRFSIGIQD